MIAGTSSASFALSLLRAARTQGCEVFPEALLRALARRYGADHGAINTFHPAGFVASVGLGYDLEAMSAQWHAIGGAALDTLTQDMHVVPGSVVCANSGSAAHAAHAAPWRAFLARHGIAHQMGVALAFEGSETMAHLYLNRGPQSPPYSPPEVRAFARVVPAVREALLVNRLYAGAYQQLHEPGLAQAATDAQGWILFANDAFCRVWPALARIGDQAAPRIPAPWLQDEPQALRSLGEAGWQMEVSPLESASLRVSFRPQMVGMEVQALTARQLEVARLYCRGLAYKDIGAQLGLSPATVRVHLRNAYARRAVNSRAALRASLGF